MIRELKASPNSTIRSGSPYLKIKQINIWDKLSTIQKEVDKEKKSMAITFGHDYSQLANTSVAVGQIIWII